MENLNAEEIIKALECCTRGRKSKEDRPCLDCPYNECNLVGGTSERQIKGTCQGWLMKDALALIKSQEQRIKELTVVNEQILVSSIDLEKQVERLSEKNERLTKGRFDFEELFVVLEFLALFAFASAGAICVLLPIGLAINISWWYLFLYLVTIPILVGIILFLCYKKEEDEK